MTDHQSKAHLYMVNHYQKLVGKTVKSVCYNGDECEPMYGLEFADGTCAWILRDPEGNGPGHLDITDTKGEPI